MFSLKKVSFRNVFLILFVTGLLLNSQNAVAIESLENKNLNLPIVMIDMNMAEEEYQALLRANPDRPVIRVPSLVALKNPAIMSVVLSRITAEGARFTACRDALSGTCSFSTQRSLEADSALSKVGWNFEEELKYQFSRIQTEIGSIYISGHYENGTGGNGGLIGKWGKTNTKTISDLMKKSRAFDKTGFVGLLSCYFTRDGLLQSNFPLVNERPLMIVGYKGTGPLASNPEAARYIKSFSELDNLLAQPKKDLESIDATEIIKTVKKSNSTRQISGYKSNGNGELHDLFEIRSKPLNALPSTCSPATQKVLEKWISDVSASNDINSKRTQDLTLQSLHQSFVKILESGSIADKSARANSNSNCANSIRERRDVSELIRLVGLQKNATAAVISSKLAMRAQVSLELNELISKKDQMTLAELKQNLNRIEGRLITELQEQFQRGDAYSASSEQLQEIINVKRMKFYMGIETDYIDTSASPITDMEQQLVLQKVAFYSADRQSRIKQLQQAMEKTFDTKVPISEFKEFGESLMSVRIRLRSELEAQRLAVTNN